VNYTHRNTSNSRGNRIKRGSIEADSDKKANKLMTNKQHVLFYLLNKLRVQITTISKAQKMPKA